MKINKVASSKTELDLYNILAKRSIVKEAILGRAAAALGAYTAGSAAIDFFKDQMEGDEDFDLDTFIETHETALLRHLDNISAIKYDECISAMETVKTKLAQYSSSETTSDSEPINDFSEVGGLADFTTLGKENSKGIKKFANAEQKAEKIITNYKALKDLNESSNLHNLVNDYILLKKQAVDAHANATGVRAKAEGAVGSTLGFLGGVADEYGLGTPHLQNMSEEQKAEQIQKVEVAEELHKELFEKYEEVSKSFVGHLKHIGLILEDISNSKILDKIDSLQESEKEPLLKSIEYMSGFFVFFDKNYNAVVAPRKRRQEYQKRKREYESGFNAGTGSYETRVKKEDLGVSMFRSENKFLHSNDKPFLKIQDFAVRLPTYTNIRSFTEKTTKRVNFALEHILGERKRPLGLGRNYRKEFFNYLSRVGFVRNIKNYYASLFEFFTDSKTSEFGIENRDELLRTSLYAPYNFDNTVFNFEKLVEAMANLADIEGKVYRGSSTKLKEGLSRSISDKLSRFFSREVIPTEIKIIRDFEKQVKKIDKIDERNERRRKRMVYSSQNNQNNQIKNNDSINNKGLDMKKANSDQYYKDALMGSNNSDPLLKEFYNSMKQETLRRSELRDDRKNLEVFEESQDITNMAHPKSIKLSDGHGDGGLVENGHEQKEKSLEVAKRNPTGNFMGRYAWMSNKLKK